MSAHGAAGSEPHRPQTYSEPAWLRRQRFTLSGPTLTFFFPLRGHAFHLYSPLAAQSSLQSASYRETVTELRQQLALPDNGRASGQDTRGSLSPPNSLSLLFSSSPICPGPGQAAAVRGEQRESRRGSAPQYTNNSPSHSALAHQQSSVPYTVLSFPAPFNLMQGPDQPPRLLGSLFSRQFTPLHLSLSRMAICYAGNQLRGNCEPASKKLLFILVKKNEPCTCFK